LRSVEPTQDDQQLAKTLSVGQAVGLGITLVVGGGLLVLPGIAYREVGDAAIYAWVADALLVLPLLVVFGWLGSRYPSAGGIAGFVQAGFGRTGAAATEVLLVGTFCLGTPAIAITGGNYVAAAIGGSGGVAAGAALVLLAVGGAVNWLGSAVSGRLQQVLAVVLVVLLTGGAAAALLAAPVVDVQVSELSDWELAVPALGIVFFAYTGWEMLSFTAEEYRNPRRDFPLAIAGSFVAVVGMYLLIALGVQRSLDAEDPETVRAPVAALLSATFGPDTGRLVGGLGAVIIAANVVGAVWAASRLFFASAREGLLPARLARLDPVSRAPRAAIAVCLGVMAVVWLAHTLGLVSLSLLLRLPGQNFLILYGLSVAAFVVLVRGVVLRAVGLLAGVLVLATAATFGPGLVYSASLMLVGAVLVPLRAARRARLTRPRR
jgi:amino acid efflux transporter